MCWVLCPAGLSFHWRLKWRGRSIVKSNTDAAEIGGKWRPLELYTYTQVVCFIVLRLAVRRRERLHNVAAVRWLICVSGGASGKMMEGVDQETFTLCHIIYITNQRDYRKRTVHYWAMTFLYHMST